MTFPEPRTLEAWWRAVDGNWNDLEAIVEKYASNLIEQLDRAHERCDGMAIVRIFNAAWFAAPDDPSIRDMPGWLLLCDLCSEADVLELHLG
jgi:hypothetical protein